MKQWKCWNKDCRLTEEMHGHCWAASISPCWGELEEQHWPKRSQGGKWIAAILCAGHHAACDGGGRYRGQRLANDVKVTYAWCAEGEGCKEHTCLPTYTYRIWERGKGEALVTRQLPEGTYGEGEADGTRGSARTSLAESDGAEWGTGRDLLVPEVSTASRLVSPEYASTEAAWEGDWVDRFYSQWVSTGRHTMALRQMVEDYRLRYTGDNWHKRCSQAIEEHRGIHFQDATLDDWSRQYRAYEDAAADPAFAEYRSVLQALGPSVWREIAHAPQEHWRAMVAQALGEVADGGIQPLLAARVRRAGQREGLLPNPSYLYICRVCGAVKNKQADLVERRAE